MTSPPALARLASKAETWWEQRSPREQVILLIGGVVAVIFLTWSLLLYPLSSARTRALDDIRISESVIARLRAAGPAMAAPGARRAVNPADAATAMGLTIRRSDPEGRRTRMTLEDADFETVLRWLEQVERDGAARIVNVRMERRPAPGAVNADITLEAP